MKLDLFKRNKIVLSFAVALVLVIAGVAYESVFSESDAAGLTDERASNPAATVQIGTTSGELTFLGPNTIADIAESAKKAVVAVTATPVVSEKTTRYRTRDPFYDMLWYFFGIDPYEGFSNQYTPQPSSGTGFVISKDGYILTNNHVIEGNNKITVTLLDGTVCDAEVVRSMSNPDVAVLKINAEGKDLTALPLGDSSTVRPGEWAIAIGNPLNMGITVTAGIISATHRGDDPAVAQMFGNIAIPPEGFIQTDAAINLGNSGGPLLNLKGEVIGINTAVVMGGENVGFAIPINSVVELLPKLMTESKGGYLGVSLFAADANFARRLGVSEGAAVVYNVISGSPAGKAGLRRYDVIIEINGEEVKSVDDVPFEISSHAPGEEIEITFIRENRINVITVELTESPQK